MNATFLKMQMQVWGALGAVKSGAGRAIRRLAKDERAVSVIEYAILLGVIVGAVTVAVTTFGNEIQTAINDIAGRVTTTIGGVGNT